MGPRYAGLGVVRPRLRPVARLIGQARIPFAGSAPPADLGLEMFKPAALIVAASVLAAGVLAGPAGVLSASPATAVASGKPTVRASQLPTVAEAATVFDYLAGGRRSVLTAEAEEPVGDGCNNWRSVLRAPVGRWEHFTMANGNGAYFVGYDDPGVFTYKYASKKKARRAMTRLASWITRCSGSHGDADFSWTVTPAAVSGVGQQVLGIRERSRSGMSGGGYHVKHELSLAVRSGRYLTVPNIQTENAQADLEVGLAWARVAISAI